MIQAGNADAHRVLKRGGRTSFSAVECENDAFHIHVFLQSFIAKISSEVDARVASTCILKHVERHCRDQTEILT